MRKLVSALLVSLVGFCAVLEPALAESKKPERGVVVMPKAIPGNVSIGGEYWALIIGIDKYQHAPKLESAVKDATGVRDVLVERYGFKRDHVMELLDQQATGSNIQDALYQLGQKAGQNDSVLIYYAGHGQYDEDGRLGWWVPVEAEPKKPGTFIMDVSILNYVKGMKAKHVYLIADSCFSGTLFGTRALPPINDQWFSRLYAKQSRWGLTSGGTEPVADRGKDGHSVFAYHFITLLRENEDPYLVPSRIHDRLASLVANNADQTPRSEPLRGAGDEGGQFVFQLASGVVAKGSSSASGPRPELAPSTASRQVESVPSVALRPPKAAPSVTLRPAEAEPPARDIEKEEMEAMQKALNQKVLDRPFNPGDQAAVNAYLEDALKKGIIPSEVRPNGWRRGYTCDNLRSSLSQYRDCLYYHRYHGRYYPY